METAMNTTRHDSIRRIDGIGWGLLFLMTGGLALVPGLPDAAWLLGLGIILLGLNAARVRLGVAPDWFTVILGSVALVAGGGSIAGLAVPGFELFLILCGIAIVAGQLRRGR